MTIERTASGAWNIYGIDASGYFRTRTYYGYTRRAALAMYRAELTTGKD